MNVVTLTQTLGKINSAESGYKNHTIELSAKIRQNFVTFAKAHSISNLGKCKDYKD